MVFKLIRTCSYASKPFLPFSKTSFKCLGSFFMLNPEAPSVFENFDLCYVMMLWDFKINLWHFCSSESGLNCVLNVNCCCGRGAFVCTACWMISIAVWRRFGDWLVLFNFFCIIMSNMGICKYPFRFWKSGDDDWAIRGFLDFNFRLDPSPICIAEFLRFLSFKTNSFDRRN